MARTALYGPAHRVMQRMPPGSGAGGPANAAPSLDMGGSGIQDSRLGWNTGNSSTGAEVIGWYGANHPHLDFVPSTLTTNALAAAQAGVAGTPLTLVSSTAAGITVSSSAQTLFPSQNLIPAGAKFIDSQPVYQRFGSSDFTVFYDAATMGQRAITITSAGNDSTGNITLVGFDAYGYTVTQTLTLGNAGAVTTTKTFKGLISAIPHGTLSGGNISLGQSDVYGLPFYTSAVTALWGFWNNLILTGTGTFVAGVTTNPATAATGDVRGTFIPATASNNTRRLQLWQHPSLAAMVANGINIGMFGVPQF